MSAPEFDIHDHRHQLKQLRDSGDTKLFENRDDLACPVCERRFSRLFSTKEMTASFPENDGSRFCLLRTESLLYLFRH